MTLVLHPVLGSWRDKGLIELLAGGREGSPLPFHKLSWYHGVAAPGQDEYYSVCSAQRRSLFCFGGKSIEAVKRERRHGRGDTSRRCVSGDMWIIISSAKTDFLAHHNSRRWVAG